MLPARFEQMDLFQCSTPNPEPKPKRRQPRPKATKYRCEKCGKTLDAYLPIFIDHCGCGGKMKREGS